MVVWFITRGFHMAMQEAYIWLTIWEHEGTAYFDVGYASAVVVFFFPSPKPYHWRVGVIWIGCHIPLSCIKFSLYSFVFFVVLVLPLMFTQFLPFSFAQLTSAILFYASLYVNLINFPLYVTHINVNVFLMYTLCSTG